MVENVVPSPWNTFSLILCSKPHHHCCIQWNSVHHANNQLRYQLCLEAFLDFSRPGWIRYLSYKLPQHPVLTPITLGILYCKTVYLLICLPDETVSSILGVSV